MQIKVELPSQAILLKQKQTIKQCLHFVIDLCLLIIDLSKVVGQRGNDPRPQVFQTCAQTI